MKSAILKYAGLVLTISTVVTSLPFQAPKSEPRSAIDSVRYEEAPQNLTGSAVDPVRYKDPLGKNVRGSKTTSFPPTKSNKCETGSPANDIYCRLDCLFDDDLKAEGCP